jgi:hypothetical protein
MFARSSDGRTTNALLAMRKPLVGAQAAGYCIQYSNVWKTAPSAGQIFRFGVIAPDIHVGRHEIAQERNDRRRARGR